MGKLAVLLGVVVVVAAAIGAYWFFFADQDELKSDYTLLDSDDKIKEGLTIKTKMELDDEVSDMEMVVDSVSGGMVKYHFTSKGSIEYDLLVYKPLYFDFDYTATAPSGVTVTKDGNTYTINGSYTKSDTTCSYDGLKIIFDGSTVTSVSGAYGSEIKKTSYVDSTENTVRTEDGKADVTTKRSYTDLAGRAVDEFYDWVFLSFDPADYSGPNVTVKETEGRVGNVKTQLYTINGTTSDDRTFKDVEIHVYKGYILKADGEMDDDDQTYRLYIYLN